MKICKCGHLNCDHSVRYIPLRYGKYIPLRYRKCKKCSCMKFEEMVESEFNKWKDNFVNKILKEFTFVGMISSKRCKQIIKQKAGFEE